jgi:hypothetical protein
MKNIGTILGIFFAVAAFVVLVVGIRDTLHDQADARYDAAVNRSIDSAIDADVRCHARCAAAGWGSLNAFYSPRHARCMCQDVSPHGHIYNDYEGYRVLRPGDVP